MKLKPNSPRYLISILPRSDNTYLLSYDEPVLLRVIMHRTGEYIKAGAFMLAASVGSLAVNEVMMDSSDTHISRQIELADNCASNVSLECLDASGAIFAPGIEDVRFDDHSITVPQNYIEKILSEAKPDPIDRNDRRLTTAISAVLLSGLTVGLVSTTAQIREMRKKPLNGSQATAQKPPKHPTIN